MGIFEVQIRHSMTLWETYRAILWALKLHGAIRFWRSWQCPQDSFIYRIQSPRYERFSRQTLIFILYWHNKTKPSTNLLSRMLTTILSMEWASWKCWSTECPPRQSFDRLAVKRHAGSWSDSSVRVDWWAAVKRWRMTTLSSTTTLYICLEHYKAEWRWIGIKWISL